MTDTILRQLLTLDKPTIHRFKGYDIIIDRDDSPDNPRDTDDISTIVSFGYGFGDKSFDDVKNFILSIDAILSRAIYLYKSEIGILHLSPPSESIDGKLAGYIYTSKDVIAKRWGWTRITADRKERILAHLDNQLAKYNMYILKGFLKSEIRKYGETLHTIHTLDNKQTAYDAACIYINELELSQE